MEQVSSCSSSWAVVDEILNLQEISDVGMDGVLYKVEWDGLNTITPRDVPKRAAFSPAAPAAGSERCARDGKLYYRAYGIKWSGEKVKTIKALTRHIQAEEVQIHRVGVPDASCEAVQEVCLEDFVGVDIAQVGVTEFEVLIRDQMVVVVQEMQTGVYCGPISAYLAVSSCPGTTIWDFIDNYSYILDAYRNQGHASLYTHYAQIKLATTRRSANYVPSKARARKPLSLPWTISDLPRNPMATIRARDEPQESDLASSPEKPSWTEEWSGAGFPVVMSILTVFLCVALAQCFEKCWRRRDKAQGHKPHALDNSGIPKPKGRLNTGPYGNDQDAQRYAPIVDESPGEDASPGQNAPRILVIGERPPAQMSRSPQYPLPVYSK